MPYNYLLLYMCIYIYIPYIIHLGGGFKIFLFSALPGEMIQFDKCFSNGLKPPTRHGWYELFQAGCFGFLAWLISIVLFSWA